MIDLGAIKNIRFKPIKFDLSLMFCIASLISIGLIMVASSSMDFANSKYSDPWFFIKKQVVFLLLGLIAASLVLSVPNEVWNKTSGVLLLFSFTLLIAVLIPGVGKSVNGSQRWIDFGPVGIQASEIAKCCLIIYFASYLSRRNIEVRHSWFGFLKMIIVMGIVALLLLLEPDFGSAVVICVTLCFMMFVAGIRVFRFFLLAVAGVCAMTMLAVVSPYRWERILAFLDPWANQFDSGYQLVQSLIAFGRGEWFGLGLGNSLQKLFFLPEAHTDFIFAIYAEEFGLIGALILIAIFGLFIAKIFQVGSLAAERDNSFACYLCYGVGIMFAIQTFINMGVASGLMPTKGLTLPFISYGGSSLLITCILVSFVLRVDLENHQATHG
ncbi:MAG: putative lipid II flippase FtsW [Cellvibrionaceae bacterium]|nr:putative lipid II flippase FtsW [Cellvibrionaceae bacterium]